MVYGDPLELLVHSGNKPSPESHKAGRISFLFLIIRTQVDKTLLKGLMVLETISRLDGEAQTLEQIAAEVGLTRSNTHRTLQTLAHAGYVRRDAETGAYRCTLKMFELGARQLVGMDARRLAPPFMRELSRATKETVHLSVLYGLDVVYVDNIVSAQ